MEMGRTRFKVDPGKTLETPSQSISWEWWLAPVIPATREAGVGGS
jgi:hypothetical protein